MATSPADDQSVLRAALAYAECGIAVFPCQADNKRPYLKHGFKDASTDTSEIRLWWSRWPDAMVACPTGSKHGIWVLDIDDPSEFEAAIAKLGLELPVTRSVRTGKGCHLYFMSDDEVPVRNSQRSQKGWPLESLPGAETRGDGGYVILPPSRHPNGERYTWICKGPPVAAPAELLNIVCSAQAKRSVRKPLSKVQNSDHADTPYGVAALRGECDSIRRAPCGSQESTLNSASLKIGSLVAGKILTLSSAKQGLIDAGLSMVSHVPSDPWTTKAIISKVDRALSDAACNPRFPALRLVGSEQDRPEPKIAETQSSEERPVIKVRDGDLHILADQAQQALLDQDTPFFVRGGLVRPIIDELAASNGQKTRVPRLTMVDRDYLLDRMSRSAKWTKRNVRLQQWVPTNPPHSVASILLAREGEWQFRQLSGVTATPTLRPDGTILSEAGYDEITQLLMLSPPQLPTIPKRPSRAEALEALALLDGLLGDFPFLDAGSKSAALSGLITPIVRGALSVAPLHAVTSPVAGSGKTFLIDLASTIATGELAPVLTAGRTEEETEKRLIGAMLGGQPFINIDNVNGELGGDALCQMIERPLISVRPLGSSKLVKIENRATCYATGNNIQLVGDMTRRVILCSLDPNVERPELRTFRQNPIELVLSDRGKFIAAALTVVRAHAVAGFPGLLTPLASFAGWSRFVRSALVWLDCADPVETMLKTRAEDPVVSQLAGLFRCLASATGGRPLTCGSIKDLSERQDALGQLIYPELRTALAEVADDQRGGIDTRRLGRYLGRYNGRIVDGLKLIAGEDAHAKQKTWCLVPIT